MLEIGGSTLPLARIRDQESRRLAGVDVWREDLLRIKACGFDAVDLVDSWLRVDLLDSGELDLLRSVFDATGVCLLGVSVVRASVIEPERGSSNLKRTLAAVDAAARLGSPLISIGFHRELSGPQQREHFWVAPHPEDSDSDENLALACTRVVAICNRAAEHSMLVSLELHESTLLDRSDRVLHLLDRAAAPNLGVNLDIGNLVRVPHDPAEPWRQTVDRLAPHVNYWHLKNYLRVEHESGLAMSTPCSIDMGEIDYRYALSVLLDNGYRGPLCLEHYGGDAFAAMQRGAGYLNRLLIELGQEAA